MVFDHNRCVRCNKAPPTKKLAHPDCGMDFGVMGSMELCDRCYKIVSDELQDEIDDSGIEDGRWDEHG